MVWKKKINFIQYGKGRQFIGFVLRENTCRNMLEIPIDRLLKVYNNNVKYEKYLCESFSVSLFDTMKGVNLLF